MLISAAAACHPFGPVWCVHDPVPPVSVRLVPRAASWLGRGWRGTCRTATPARQLDRVEVVVQDRCAPRECSRPPRRDLRERRVVGVGALAVPRQSGRRHGTGRGTIGAETGGAGSRTRTGQRFRQTASALKHATSSCCTVDATPFLVCTGCTICGRACFVVKYFTQRCIFFHVSSA